MELITILNRCHRFRGFVYQHAYFSADKKSIEVAVRFGIDEIQYAKGHKYLTLVYQIDRDVTRLLWVGRERTIESFRGFFAVIGDELASKIVFVCSDRWESPIGKSFARNAPRRFTSLIVFTSSRK